MPSKNLSLIIILSIEKRTFGIYLNALLKFDASKVKVKKINVFLGDIEEKLKSLKGNFDFLVVCSLEMEGTFGRIHRGTYRTEESRESFSVIVKTVSG